MRRSTLGNNHAKFNSHVAGISERSERESKPKMKGPQVSESGSESAEAGDWACSPSQKIPDHTALSSSSPPQLQKETSATWSALMCRAPSLHPVEPPQVHYELHDDSTDEVENFDFNLPPSAWLVRKKVQDRRARTFSISSYSSSASSESPISSISPCISPLFSTLSSSSATKDRHLNSLSPQVLPCKLSPCLGPLAMPSAPGSSLACLVCEPLICVQGSRNVH